MQGEKILTVSIAAYNVEKYIDQTLKSLVVPEIMDKLEVLVIDDGGKDSTVDIVERYVDQYPDTFKLIRKENGGWGSTVNCGLKNATGKYFKLLDGDDYFSELARFIDVLQQTDADLVYTPYVIFYENGDYKICDKLTQFDGNKVIPLDDFIGKIEYGMHSCAFKTECIRDRVSITEHCFYTDVEYVLKSIMFVNNLLICNDIPVYWYRLGLTGQSISRQGYIKHFDEHLKVLHNLLEIYDSLNDNEIYKKIYKTRIYDMVDQQYYLYLILKGNLSNAAKLKEFDLYIKESYPEFYESTRNRVKLFRVLGKICYPLIVYK